MASTSVNSDQDSVREPRNENGSNDCTNPGARASAKDPALLRESTREEACTCAPHTDTYKEEKSE